MAGYSGISLGRENGTDFMDKLGAIRVRDREEIRVWGEMG